MAVQFGVGTLQISATAGTMTIGKVQTVSMTVGYETANLRGSTDVFPCDTQHFDGSIEGSFEHGNIDLSNIAIMIAGSGSHAGAGGSGTFTLTAASLPSRFKLILTVTTNGVTSTITLHSVFVPSLTLDFSRTEYVIPSMNFVAENASGGTGLMTWQM